MKVTCEPKHIRTVNSDKTSKSVYDDFASFLALTVHNCGYLIAGFFKMEVIFSITSWQCSSEMRIADLFVSILDFLSAG